MTYSEARQLLEKHTRGKKVRAWEVLDASKRVKNYRELVPCPKCRVNKIMRFQAMEGQTCYHCMNR